MAKREISSTLRSLKFMQRASQKVEESKPKIEEADTKSEVNGPCGASTPSRKCVVIKEGNPHPGALKGRMSFQSFNPSIDKLHVDNDIVSKMQASIINPQNGSSNSANSPANGSDLGHKRRQHEIDTEKPSSSKSQKVVNGEGSKPTSSNYNSRQKKLR